MYIRRKVFSVAYDENGEEKLFSTTEIMSEESYLEKLYSEKKKEDDDTKLKLGHRLNIAMYKSEGKLGRKYEKDNLEGNVKESAKNNAVIGATQTALGAGIGAAIGAKKKGLKGAKEGAKAGAAAGGFVGGATAIGGTLGTAAVKGLRKVSKGYNAKAEQRLDEIKVAEGKMTKKEYADKWYKKDKKD